MDTYNTISIKPSDIQPVHEVRDHAKYHALAESIYQGGWAGRPLLVCEGPEGCYSALTGAHRLAAAARITTDYGQEEFDQDLTVPCVIFSAEDLDEDAISELFDARDDEDREAILRNASLTEAADLMAEECAANEA